MSFPNKILITGLSGSGKTTLARRIEEELHLPAVSFDNFCFNEKHNFISCYEIAQVFSGKNLGEKWVFEGVYGVVLDEYIKKAELLIYLDTSLFQNIINLLKRKIRKIFKLKENKNTNNIMKKQIRNFKSIWVKRRVKKDKWNEFIKNSIESVKFINVKNINNRKIDKIINEIRNMV